MHHEFQTVKVWKRALTREEINRSMYNIGTSNSTVPGLLTVNLPQSRKTVFHNWYMSLQNNHPKYTSTTRSLSRHPVCSISE